MLPPHVHASIAEHLKAPPTDLRSVGGGSIHRATEFIADGRRWFVKWSAADLPGVFSAEVRGLRLLADAGALRVPAAEAWLDPSGSSPGFLLLTHYGEGGAPPGGSYADALGRGVAALHAVEGSAYGLDHDNWIGSLPQSNRPGGDWLSFWWQQRIEPLTRRARDARALSPTLVRDIEALAGRWSEWLPESPRPSLLHGDIWSGNVARDGAGAPVIFDPAVYFGDREVDLAMTTLFGGFPVGWLDAYRSVAPLEPGFGERFDLYNLYPLLVHVNLFGGSYVRSVREIVGRFV